MTEGVKAFLRRYNAWVAPKGEAVKVFLLRCKGWATSKAESIKAFLRRHKGWLTVLGAGVILATYVMKDILRDNERDLKDAVETARRAFVVGRGIHGLYESVLSLSYRVNSRLGAILEKARYRNLLCQRVRQIQLLKVHLVADIAGSVAAATLWSDQGKSFGHHRLSRSPCRII
jgi:hypothetical protein